MCPCVAVFHAPSYSIRSRMCVPGQVQLRQRWPVAAADPLVVALDEGALEAGESSPYRRSERGVWMRYDNHEGGWQKWCRCEQSTGIGD